ncbi:MAG: HAMP domain-containing sensor histidine kinase, partial [Myxococcota bacterium]
PVANALVSGCQRASTLVRIYAATEAAYFLQDAPPTIGYGAMQAMNIDAGLSLKEAARLGIPTARLATYKYRRARLLIALGSDPTVREDSQRRYLDEGLDEMWRLGFEIAELDAPEAAQLIEVYGAKEPEGFGAVRPDDYSIQHQLLSHGRHQDEMRLQEFWDRAERRRAAFMEIKDRIATRAPEEDAKPKFVWDQYSDTPYLVYFGWSGDFGVALQLEQQLLLEDFLARTGEYRHQISITDADGEWVAGAQPGPDAEYRESAPFKGLTHLRVRVLETAATNRLRSEQWVLPFGIMGVCLMLGIAALVAQERFTRRQYELLNRQRAFTTRVTHELKTPLAGIRVMAENLEAGAFRTDEQREDMAHRIIEEADRLKSRVDEVLDVARERTIPSPAPFDPEEAVLEAIDQWGPRLETAGVKLHADLHPTDEAMGDLGAFRDAVGILLDNALKYRRTDRSDPQVWLELAQEGRHIVIAVADNGLGVPKAMRKAIFDRFVRVEGPNRGASGGHGLGLNQAREIIEAHRGSLVCVDGVDGGARFVMRIPARRLT